jgi:peptide/nickel transport system substrate-binding protein
LFERGEIDVLTPGDRPSAIHFETDPAWVKYVLHDQAPSISGHFMNTEMVPFTDVRVRRAVAAAINRPNITRYDGHFTRVTGHPIPPKIPGYIEHPDYEQTYNLDQAREWMRQAGYAYDPATQKGGYPKPITYYVGEGDGPARSAQLLQYELSQIGLRIEIKQTTFAAYLALTGRPKTVAMGTSGWSMDYPDPSDFLEPLFSGHSISQEDSDNKAFYSNPKLDDLLDRAHVELDGAKRTAMYHEAEKIICDDAPWAFESSRESIEIAQPWVHDYLLHPVFTSWYQNAWIDRQSLQSQPALGALGAASPMFASGLPHMRGTR